ncbi:transmembrane epididymal protein 1-like [Lepus europaeus]|uniref:transmembrane epididymal protein 1-like n=1 Tax=Lepus europaeus TaxID=9983 RepID=UPI002B48FEF9|nr:transmembrane epididymal protein 1-like [Lepus europaeus]
MGKFNGHFYPGLYLFYYGLYQATVVSRALICNDPLLWPPRPPRSEGRWGWLWTLSYTGLLKMAAGSMLTLYVVFCLEDGMVLMDRHMLSRFMYPREWQHLTMFVLLALLGCVELASSSLLPRRCVALEKGALALAFYELLLLFVSHAQGSERVELQVHALLLPVVLLLTLVLTAQLWAPAACQLWLMESFLFLVMGSWLVQAGFILYRPISGFPWQDDDIGDIMFVTTFFCWHVMADALCLLAVHGFSFFWLRCCSPRSEPAGPTGALRHAGPPGPLYMLLQEAEQSEKEEGALLLPQAQPGP